MFGHHILKTYLRHRLTKICILRRISLVTSHVSHPYNSFDICNCNLMRSCNINVNSVTSLSIHLSAVPTKTFMAGVTALFTTEKLLKTQDSQTERNFTLEHSPDASLRCVSDGLSL